MSRTRILALLLAGPFLATGLGFLLGFPWLLPLLAALVPLPVFVRGIRGQRYGAVLGWMLLWAVAQSLAVVVLTLAFPERAAESVLRGPSYAAEMLTWVRTGVGPEGSPRLYLPVHARHYAAFCVLAVASAGTAALVLGTVLLDYMNYYVAELVRASAVPAGSALLGWPVWAVIRVAGFVTTAVGLAPVGWNLLFRLRGRAERLRVPRRLLLAGFGLVVLDAVLKAALAPVWQGWLRRFLGE